LAVWGVDTVAKVEALPTLALGCGLNLNDQKGL
jgi:hypothetical protein